jgi:hypothetical protein
MASISITVGALTVSRSFPDEKASRLFEWLLKYYLRKVRSSSPTDTPIEEPPTARTKLEFLLQKTVESMIVAAREEVNTTRTEENLLAIKEEQGGIDVNGS